jgi:NTP pyrophosphatase (non-canonical NTP hydrolase)
MTRSDWNPWDDVEKLTAWLDASNGTGRQELILRVLKLQEEAGEVAEAVIGMVGQNPRKGITHSATDVVGELCDVIVTAMVAVQTLTGNPVVSRRHLAAKFAKLHARVDEAGWERLDLAEIRGRGVAPTGADDG